MNDEVLHSRQYGDRGRFVACAPDLTDRVFARLTVLRRVETMSKKFVEWECRCVCGTTKVIRSSCLSDGTTQSCGCLARERRLALAEDYTGRVFGRLTVRSRLIASPGTKSLWLCQCSCGQQIVRPIATLKSGSTASCGCLERDQKTERRAAFVGRRYGRLTVICEAESPVSHKARFQCQCDCGRAKIISANSLRQGTVSCGCAVSDRDSTLRTDQQKLQGRRVRHTRLARQRQATGTFTEEDVKSRLKWQRGRCAAPNCRIRLDNAKYHIDHIEPLSPRHSKTKNRSNLNAARNIQILCESCNTAKLDKDPIDWARSCGFLL